MARGLIDQYGPTSSQPQKPTADCGGVLPGDEVDVMNYKPPQGPKGIMNPKSPGLHGTNRNNDQRPMPGSESGSAGLGGRMPLKGGSQGQY